MKAMLLPLTFAIAFPSLGVDGSPSPAAASAPLQCVAQPSAGDLLGVSCRLPAAALARHFRFKVDFAGGHDDTMASMALTLDGEPIVCEPGSKTRLMGEDGDVSLECRFELSGETRANAVVAAVIKWSHAQYVGFELVAI